MHNEKRYPSRRELRILEENSNLPSPNYYAAKTFIIFFLAFITIFIPVSGALNIPVSSIMTYKNAYDSMFSKIDDCDLDSHTNLKNVVSAPERYKVRISAKQACVADNTVANGNKLANKTYRLQWPLYEKTFQLTSPFGYREDPINGRTVLHTGTDMAGPLGTPILSVADGTVTIVDVYGGAGRVVIHHEIDGKKFDSWYLHMYPEDIVVKQGQKISMGEKIGTIGSSGHSTGPHLHFEIHPDGGDPVDAHKWLEANNAVLTSKDC